MANMCKRIISAEKFLIFFKILILRVISELKGQKMAQNNKKLSVTLHVYGSISTANKYNYSASHHEQKMKKNTVQIKFLAVTIKQ